MDKYIFDKNNGLWYELIGDYYLPCLKMYVVKGKVHHLAKYNIAAAHLWQK